MDKKTGIFSWYGYYTDYRRRIEAVKNAGFDGLMLWWEDEYGEYPCTRKEQVRLARENELEIFNIHIADIDHNFIWHEDRSMREKHLFLIRDTICEIADEGLHNLVIHLCESQDVPEPGAPLLRSIEYLLPFAQDNKVTLSLENTWRADYLEAVWQEFPNEGLGFCFDTSHANLRHHFDLLRNHYDLLTALHLSDNDGIEDRHWPPFDGVIDYKTLVTSYLKQTDVPYTMELIADRKRYPSETDFLRIAKERIDRLLALEDEVE